MITEFRMSYLQINALKVKRNKSREFLLKNLIYNLLIQCMCDFWNNLDFADNPDDTLE